ncbi:unnamed protein product [Oikopleura dioica]|uniref:SWI/SNF-related matrix-associated actin-dependent regulator of chromatin subfamily A-like protein 1 n=1 Tax=Oikopleura dioica TaxID=34765 RepID=E4WQ82_OIKDI|nr:unnamed protein product [Oikopleura dioica]
MIPKASCGRFVQFLRENGHYFDFDSNEKVLADKTNIPSKSAASSDGDVDNIVVNVEFLQGENGKFCVRSDKWLDRDAYKLLIDEIFNKVLLPNGERAGKYSDRWRLWVFDLDCYHDFMKVVQNARIKRLTVNPFPTIVTRYLRQKPADTTAVSPNVPEKLLTALYPFQREGVDQIIRRGGKAILADEMGLGKTIQALALAAHYRKDWPLLIVAPSSVKFNWLIELSNWIGEIVSKDSILVLYTGKDVAKIRNTLKVVITSYEMTTKIVNSGKHMTDTSIFSEENDRKSRFRMVILDESHYIKTATAQRAKSTKLICNGAARVLCLSGTPALAKPIELHSQIEVVSKDLFSNRHSFGQRYCAAYKSKYGWNYSGSDNLQELNLILSKTIMIRRLKSQVLKDLPPKIRKIIYMKVTDSPMMKKCNKIFQNIQKLPAQMTKNDFKEMELEKLSDKFEEADSSPLTIWNKWYCATGDAKIKAVSEYLIEKLENESEKIIVFAHHRAVIDSLEQNISPKIKGNLIKITGSTRSDDRTTYVEQFQNNENIKCALLSITAVNMGVTLTKASTVVFAELHYTPGVMVQAEDRAHRIGRETDVNIEYLIAKNTADEWIWRDKYQRNRRSRHSSGRDDRRRRESKTYYTEESTDETEYSSTEYDTEYTNYESTREARRSSSRQSLHRTPSSASRNQRRSRSSYGSDRPTPKARRRLSYSDKRRPYPSGNIDYQEFNDNGSFENESCMKKQILTEKTRMIIRRVALAVLTATIAVCIVCLLSQWKRAYDKRRNATWIEKSEFWTDYFYNQFSCSGIGIASIIVALIFV